MSTATGVIVNLAGAIALLLWGVRMVRTGVVRAWGDRLRVFLKTRLDNAAKAVAAGLGATLLLQSSTATALILSGFAGAGLVSPPRPGSQRFWGPISVPPSSPERSPCWGRA